MKEKKTFGAQTHVLLIPFVRIQKYPKISSPLGDCVAMELLRGEAVGFQSFRTRVF